MNDRCSISECQNTHFKHGLCESHYLSIAREAVAEAREHGKGVDRVAPPLWRSALYVVGRLANGLVGGYQKAVRLREEDVLHIHLEEAENAIRSGAVQRAAQTLERATQIAPGDPRVTLRLGDIHALQGHHEDALGCYRQVRKDDPDNEELESKIGEALSALGRHDDAIEHLRRAADRAPESAERQHRLGMALESAGRYDEALVAFEQAAALTPREPRYQQALGFAYESLGQHQDALRCFKRAIELEQHEGAPA